MKITRLGLAVFAAGLLFPPAFAADPAGAETEKADQLTLEDVIFDASYLKKLLGPNTLVATAEEKDPVPTDAILAAGLQEKTKIFALPAEATRPELILSFPPNYPPVLRQSKDPISASFLAFIGTDGYVKCLYCYDTNNRLFALASADAMVKWRYSQTKIGKTVVPVVLAITMDFSDSANAINLLKGIQRPLSEKGNPNPLPKPKAPGG